MTEMKRSLSPTVTFAQHGSSRGPVVRGRRDSRRLGSPRQTLAGVSTATELACSWPRSRFHTFRPAAGENVIGCTCRSGPVCARFRLGAVPLVRRPGLPRSRLCLDLVVQRPGLGLVEHLGGESLLGVLTAELRHVEAPVGAVSGEKLLMAAVFDDRP